MKRRRQSLFPRKRRRKQGEISLEDLIYSILHSIYLLAVWAIKTIMAILKHILFCIINYIKAKQDKNDKTDAHINLPNKLETIKIDSSIGSYSLKDLTPQFREKLQDAVDNSLSKVEGLPPETMLLLRRKFRNWEFITKEQFSASLTDRTKESEKYLESVITDQSHKMTAAMDRITSEALGAIGGIWRTRRDRKVVGNPDGLFPKVIDPKVHGNHYEREGVFYLLRDTWATKSGYVVPCAGVVYLDTLPDGPAGIPTDCRCLLEEVFALSDIPTKFSGCITKEGKEFMKEQE